METGIPKEGFFGNRFSPGGKFPKRKGFKSYRFWVFASSFEQAEAKICSRFEYDFNNEPFPSKSYIKGPFTRGQKNQIEE